MKGSLKEIMGLRLSPGQTNIIYGEKGAGKTSFAVSVMQNAVCGRFSDVPTVAITNIVFGRSTGPEGRPYEAYPPGVYHEDTLAGTFRTTAKILKQYGRQEVNILWVLDESQNFMLSDQNGSAENQALITFLGNTRKFGLVNLICTPAIGNLAPRIRCFPGEGKSGYCSARWYKKKTVPRGLNGDIDPRNLIYYQDEDWHKGERPTTLYMEPTGWSRNLNDGLPKDAYAYDTFSTAGFSIGENKQGIPFSIKDFLDATSKGLRCDLVDNIEAFFTKWDASDGTETAADPADVPDENEALYAKLSDQCRVIDRMRRCSKPPTWDDIGMWFDEPISTLRTRYAAYLRIVENMKIENSDPNNEDLGVPQKIDMASEKNTCCGGTLRAYTQTNNNRKEAAEAPRSVRSAGSEGVA